MSLSKFAERKKQEYYEAVKVRDENVKRLFQDVGLSKEEIAQIEGLSERQISNILQKSNDK